MRITHLIEGTILRYDTSNIAYYVYNTVLCIYVYLCVFFVCYSCMHIGNKQHLTYQSLYKSLCIHTLWKLWNAYHCHIHFAYNSVNRSV